MENNKILIGVQFTRRIVNSQYEHYDIELYVLRDLPLCQLLEGIKYGLKKLDSEDRNNKEIYDRCISIFDNCITEFETETNGSRYLPRVIFTSYNDVIAGKSITGGERASFYVDNLTKPICELGFITSSRIIFDETGSWKPQGKLDVSNIIEAFDPRRTNKIFFPEYNISSRQLYHFNEEPIEIIEPTDPPKKSNAGLFFMLLPSLLTIGILMLIRGFLMSGGLASVILSAAMGITAAVTTTITWKRQKNEYEQNLKDWRNRYQDYIDSVIGTIQDRQIKDASKLDELYPDMLKLIEKDDKGIYSLNENLYSRSPQDADFLTFRLGVSDKVESMFPIKGGSKEVVFSESSFDIVSDNSGNDRLRIYLRSELSKSDNEKKENLCRLPAAVASRYKYMKDAPLLYSLKNKGALGVVDRNIDLYYSYSKYFISRMIFELCYYHSPEDLQFVVFFDEMSRWTDINIAINKYKFMPHFRGLFTDKSQFVFDAQSANLVLSSLLTIMGKRKKAVLEGGGSVSLPHIVLVVFNDHGMKEHAFAEFLPDVPDKPESAVNKLGLTFVFGTKYKEYLPAYCDDVVCFDDGVNTITPHFDISKKKNFCFSKSAADDMAKHFEDYTSKMLNAMRFFSSVYYATIAQNGKVPSTVSAFELFKDNDKLDEVVKKNWGIAACKRVSPDVTESLKVPVGRTETGIAYIDLHEKGDGPHMLVAGTTGSGKTETIITFLLGLCMQFRPDELNLLLVDMKGGGFTKRIGDLPHVVGKVTDVDGDENGTGAEYMLSRFLFALKSEIKRRKLLFNKLHVDSIDAYIKACNDIEAHIKQKNITETEADDIQKIANTESLSHLILVVDEFTELKRFTSENSNLDFMGEITTIARVGRSLGFHIILISQNIEGAITDDIRVNSRAKLCLKVATRQASKDMIGTELAASPYMPGNGRAYLLVGTGSRLEYFQSGYSGTGILEDVPVEITLASKTGAYSLFYRSDKDNTRLIQQKAELKKKGVSKTQLEAINDAINSVYKDNKESIREPHTVFQAPLPSCITMDKEEKAVGTAADGMTIAMGIYDAPLIQQKPVLYLNPFTSNIAVFGGPMSGKTTFVKTYLVRIHENRELAARENIYIIDFGGNIGDYSRLESVCACFDNSNEENIKRIFKTLERRMEENARLLGSNNYYSLYTKDPSRCPTHLTLIIENLNAFLADERYSTYQERLLKLCRDGLSKGLSIIVTANDISGTNRLMANFGQKIAFEMPADNYLEIFNTKVNKPMKLPGRGIVNLDSETYEFQCYLPFAGEEDTELHKLIGESGSVKNQNKLAAFNGDLTFDNVAAFNENALNGIRSDCILVGLDYYEHKPIYLNVKENRSVAVYGKRQFGKSNLLRIMIQTILKENKGVRFVYLDDGRKQLEEFQNIGSDNVYLTSVESFRDYLTEHGYGGKRSQRTSKAAVPPQPVDSAVSDGTPYTVFVLQSKALYQSSADAAYLMREWIPEMIGNADARNYLFIFSDVRNISAPETRTPFNNSISAAFVLDNIGEFVAEKGNNSVLGEMDAKELKAEYAKCSVGDGYFYNIEADTLEKLRFIKVLPEKK